METTRIGLALRLIFFFGLELIGLKVFATVIFELFGYLPAGMLGTFLAATVANAIVVRIWERGRLEDVGMGWNRASQRHLWLGFLFGCGAGLLVCLLPITWGAAEFAPNGNFRIDSLLLLSIGLLFGAVGEELLFRGYGFQVLLGVLGPWPVIIFFGFLFAGAHRDNLNANTLGLVNTGLWGFLLGYAFWRSGDLWLPIGLHFGWNLVLPVLGAHLSGFTMGVTGIELRGKGDALWSGGAYGPEASVLTTIVVVLLTAALYRTRFERQTVFLVEGRKGGNDDAAPGTPADSDAGSDGR